MARTKKCMDFDPKYNVKWHQRLPEFEPSKIRGLRVVQKTYKGQISPDPENIKDILYSNGKRHFFETDVGPTYELTSEQYKYFKKYMKNQNEC